MTKSTRVHKLLIRLLSNQHKRWRGMPHKNTRRKQAWRKVFPSPNYVRVEIINAVTGEKTTARAIDDSQRSLKKWLRIRNTRAQFDSMGLNPKSSWFNFTPEEWENFPIIVKVGDAQFPYVIARIGEKVTIKNKIVCSVFLQTLDNINYLSVVNTKKKLMKDWIDEHPIRVKKKAKRKKKRLEFDFDD